MVNIKDELTSGQFSIYGQCLGLISAVLLLLFGILNIISITMLLFCILAFAFCGIILLLEIPIFVKIVPGGPKIQTYIDYFENHYFRAALYFGGSLAIFLSNLISATGLNLPAITLLATGTCYGIAGAKGQGRYTSGLTGGTGVSGTSQESMA